MKTNCAILLEEPLLHLIFGHAHIAVIIHVLSCYQWQRLAAISHAYNDIPAVVE